MVFDFSPLLFLVGTQYLYLLSSRGPPHRRHRDDDYDDYNDYDGYGPPAGFPPRGFPPSRGFPPFRGGPRGRGFPAHRGRGGRRDYDDYGEMGGHWGGPPDGWGGPMGMMGPPPGMGVSNVMFQF